MMRDVQCALAIAQRCDATDNHPCTVCLQSCYGGDGGVEYTPESLWLDCAEDAAALRAVLRAAEEGLEPPPDAMDATDVGAAEQQQQP